MNKLVKFPSIRKSAIKSRTPLMPSGKKLAEVKVNILRNTEKRKLKLK